MRKITQKELEDAMRYYQSIFKIVRLIDYDHLNEKMADGQEGLTRACDPCYTIWEREKQCEECTSLRALQEKCNQKKLELYNGEIYEVISCYVEVDERPCVIELVDKIEEDYLSNLNLKQSLREAVFDVEYRDKNTGLYDERYFQRQKFMMPNMTAFTCIKYPYIMEERTTYGIEAEEVAVFDLVQQIRKNIRFSDKLIRIGIDEFLIVFKGMKKDMFEQKLQKLAISISGIRNESIVELKMDFSVFGYFCGEKTESIVDQINLVMKNIENRRGYIGVGYADEVVGQQIKLEKKEMERFNKRRILVIEDNELNREILTEYLQDDYDVLTAENGAEGYEALVDNYQTLSAILLDVYMPVCNGFEFLKRIQNNKALSSVPVIVMTGSDKVEDEVRCLDLGAVDFITKPYNIRLVQGRIRSIVNLKESVARLSEVEFDHLTGLYTLQAFYHHAKYIINENSSESYDIYVVDLMEFKMVNNTFGEKKADEVLRYLGKKYQSYLPISIGARDGDKFFFIASSKNRLSMDEFERGVKAINKASPIPHLVIKYGIYKDVDKKRKISDLCNCTLMAIDSIKGDYHTNIAFYNEAVNEKRMRNRQLENNFKKGIKKQQFVMWYQPKVDIKTEKICEAEALVRWFDDDGKMISPGEFIPLFEKDGLIRKLDEYVFYKVCEYQKSRISAKKELFPISINLSRNSLLDEDTCRRYLEIVQSMKVPLELVPLELTESATTKSVHIIKCLNDLFEAGFSFQMDDFGSGYSSLSSLSTLPFDVLKLDKSIVDQIGNKKGDIILKNMIRIAQELGMKVVAEGVEEKAQVEFLKACQCDMIQGYYYSPPKNQEAFEELLIKGVKHA